MVLVDKVFHDNNYEKLADKKIYEECLKLEKKLMRKEELSVFAAHLQIFVKKPLYQVSNSESASHS
ncbi:MAG: hypothetical protein DRO11_01020 [Methanobacteriota archaeon]|nr:MAG: hypothetical protein DRO11_01020 [Euryarchaeota archaeon]